LGALFGRFLKRLTEIGGVQRATFSARRRLRP
jgi:hypothetical protein